MPLETRAECWQKQNSNRFWCREDTNASLFGKHSPVPTEEAGTHGFVNQRIGLDKDEHTDMVTVLSSSMKAAVFVNVYGEEIKYLFSIVQKLVLENLTKL